MKFRAFDTVQISLNTSLVIPKTPFMEILKVQQGTQRYIRFLSMPRSYRAHVCSVEPSDIFENPVPSHKLAFICGEDKCQYHKNDNLIDLIAHKVLDLDVNADLIWHFDLLTAGLLHRLLVSEDKSINETGFLLNHKDPNDPEISVIPEDIEYITLQQFDADNINYIPRIEDLEVIEKAKSIKYPDGTFGLYCNRCDKDIQWAEPNQPDGSFICRGCVLIMA